jgi:hypothetical protein
LWAIMESVCKATWVPEKTGNADMGWTITGKLQTCGRPCFRRVLTVPFQHMNVIS